MSASEMSVSAEFVRAVQGNYADLLWQITVLQIQLATLTGELHATKAALAAVTPKGDA